MTAFDQDALEAGLDLVRRSGASEVEFGYLHGGDVPAAEADWYAFAVYRGARITVEHHVGPIEAVEALARRLFTGATCRRCGEPIVISDGAGCRWVRNGKRWEPGYGKPIDYTIPTAPVRLPE